MKDIKDYSLLASNTFGIDVKAFRFVEYDSVDELRGFLSGLQNDVPDGRGTDVTSAGVSADCGEVGTPVLHIGGGSNLLFTKDFPGIILHSAIKGIEVVGETDDCVDVRVGAGVVWDDFVAYAVSRQWYGAENLSLIPGEVGASAVQNIGAYGVEAKDLILSVDTIEMSSVLPRKFLNVECGYAYRQSVFKADLKGKYIVTHVTYRLSKLPVYHLDYGNIRAELEREGCALTLDNLRRIIIGIREMKLPDPAVVGNAGSFFMNPIVSEAKFLALEKEYPGMPQYSMGEGMVKIPAGWMIDQCGWKGRVLGRAGVHDKQALVLVNKGGATAQEIVHLADEIVRTVYEKFGIQIHPEVNYI